MYASVSSGAGSAPAILKATVARFLKVNNSVGNGNTGWLSMSRIVIEEVHLLKLDI
jgi:hypothetical protein